MLMHTPTALSALVHSSDVLDTQWKSFSLTNTKSRDFVGWVWYHKSMKKPSHCCSKFGGSPHATAKIGHRTCHVLNVLKGKGVLFKHKDLSFRYWLCSRFFIETSWNILGFIIAFCWQFVERSLKHLAAFASFVETTVHLWVYYQWYLANLLMLPKTNQSTRVIVIIYGVLESASFRSKWPYPRLKFHPLNAFTLMHLSIVSDWGPGHCAPKRLLVLQRDGLDYSAYND